MRTTTFLTGAGFGLTWFEIYTITKEGTSKLKSAPTLSQICEVQKQQLNQSCEPYFTRLEAKLALDH
jgi:hypothetical protein